MRINRKLLIGNYILCFLFGCWIGFWTGAITLQAGELQNVTPSPEGMVVQTSNTVVLTFTLPEGDMQQFACTPIIPGDNTPNNPRNFR
jgi:hypothetical protein